MKENITLIPYLFPILQTAKDVVTQISKKSYFRRPFGKQHGQQCQKLFQSAWKQFNDTYCTLWRKLSWKKSPLVIYKILELCFNTFTNDDKYPLLNKDTLMQPTEMQLYITKTFSTFFSTFLISSSIFEHFEKEDDPHSLSISDVMDCERRGYTNV